MASKITEDTIHNKNFQLGRLELLNELLDEEFFIELIETMHAEENNE